MSQVLNNYAAQLDQAKMPAGKKKVLQTALTLFANNGFHATTTAKIAKQAGVSEGTIYKYFKSKDDLLGKLLEPILFEIKDNFFATIDDSQSLEELVAFIVADRLEFIEVNFAFIQLIIQEVLTNRLAPQYYGAFFNGDNGMFDRVRELQSHYPEINQQLIPSQLLRAFVGPLLTYVVQERIFQIPGTTTDRQVIVKQIIASLTFK